MIDSVNNEKIVFYKKLRDSKHIKENKKFIVEGEHLVEEAYKAGLLESLILENDYDVDINVPKTIVSKRCMEKISLLKSTPKVMGVVKLKDSHEIIGNKIVVLDNVQDPGNVGTIIRSSLAFNVDTVILSLDSASIYNDKVIRSSEGNIFHVNVIIMDIIEAINKIKDKKIPVFYADMNGKTKVDDLVSSSYALVMGSEGRGISPIVKELVDNSIKIEMNKNCESLNVAVSASIIMHKMR